jgi:hypothetical protein
MKVMGELSGWERKKRDNIERANGGFYVSCGGRKTYSG